MAVHTFISALWGVGREACMLAFSLVGLTCVFIALWVGLGNGLHRNYEAPTPVRHPQPFHNPPTLLTLSDKYWCWISSHYFGERLAGEYLWLWFALFASVIMYIPLYFWAKGRLSVDENKWYKFHLKKPDDRFKVERRDALRLLL
jgi:hypothetical protein